MKLSKSSIKLIAFVLFILACVAVANLPGVKGRVTLESINTHLEALRVAANQPWGPVLFILISTAIILLHMPGLIPVVAAGLVYDLWQGFIYSWISGVIGTTLTFLIARFLLRDYFQPKLEKSFLQPFMGKIESNGILAMIILRSSMAMMPLLNWFLGASKMSNRDYLIGNLIGLGPVCFVIVFGVGKLQNIKSGWDLLQPQVLAVAGFFALIIAGMVYFRAKLFKKAKVSQK